MDAYKTYYLSTNSLRIQDPFWELNRLKREALKEELDRSLNSNIDPALYLSLDNYLLYKRLENKKKEDDKRRDSGVLQFFKRLLA